MNAIETLISVLCDPEGKCCISGSDGDRRLIDSALAELAQAARADSGFDYKTAADFLSGKTVSDEALRKFIAASRDAHDDRAALRAKMLSLRGELASREAEIALLKRSLLDAEAAPQPSPTAQVAQSADSVQEDAARYRFIRDVPYSDDVRSVLVHQQNAAMDRVIDAARKQGASHDR